MAQTYSLDEAANRLGMSVEEFKRRLRTEWTSVRWFRDGSTLRFRSSDINELARQLGESSDPGFILGTGNPLSDSSEEEASLLPDDLPDPPSSGQKKSNSGPASKPKKPALPPKPIDNELNLFEDDSAELFPVPITAEGSAARKNRAAADSDVRLDASFPIDDPHSGERTEEIEVDFDPSPHGQRSGILKTPSAARLTSGGSGNPSVPASGKLTAPASGKLTPPASGKLSPPSSGKSVPDPAVPPSARIPGPGAPIGVDSSSDFELSLDADSDSFELSINDSNTDDEVSLGGDEFEGRAGQSGINLGKPADSGVSLENKQSTELDADSDVDFELSLDAPGASGTRLGGPRSGVRVADDSDSEFELSLDDSLSDAINDGLEVEENRGDIFETDFELPAVSADDSASIVISGDSNIDLDNSDLEIAIDSEDAPIVEEESASQVILIDEDGIAEDDLGVEEDSGAVEYDEDGEPIQRRRSKLLEDDYAVEDDDGHIGAVLGKSGVSAKDDDDDEYRGPAYIPPPRWGVLPALFMLPCTIVALVGGMMVFEMVRGQWGYQQPVRPSDSLVRGLAKQFDMKTTD